MNTKEQNTPKHRFGEVLKQQWFVAYRERELGSKPLARTVLGKRLVLFRKSDGLAALELPVAMSRKFERQPIGR